ncbi:Methyltransferase domain-containing protein [Rhodovulum sp. ES.010]|uniref:SAM-dependent methyltransferase n=1 Tax=Rhodovulum sp. ES.010 TaxID=1882821 RepID=UPI00092BF6AF|nr:class I SAM-dependent methyltransferase [Rhodovulum sp. ES.010]SIO31159.1 Methyltransferase domain-containing protein [Rhodovulum sp. ES.010]
MWNDRFAGEAFVYGTAPAAFLTREAGRLPAGARVLSVAEGEGRNAVWLAGQGCAVTAVEGAPNAVAKARRLAAARGVTVDFRLCDLRDWPWEADAHDAAIGIFIQFGPRDVQDRMMAGMKRTVRPGGLVLLHGFAPRQVGYGTGGPPHAEWMYTEALLRDRFADFEIRALRDYDAEIDEGTGHRGRAALVDLVARRPAG